jgi:hypothetical protein
MKVTTIPPELHPAIFAHLPDSVVRLLSKRHYEAHCASLKAFPPGGGKALTIERKKLFEGVGHRRFLQLVRRMTGVQRIRLSDVMPCRDKNDYLIVVVLEHDDDREWMLSALGKLEGLTMICMSRDDEHSDGMWRTIFDQMMTNTTLKELRSIMLML